MAVILPVGWSDFEIGECCTDSSERGQRILVEEERFHNVTTIGAGNTRTSWSYISPTEEVYTMVGDANCAGGNMTYPSCCQVNHFMGPGAPVGTIPPFGTLDNQPAVNCLLGTSDEPVFAFANSNFRRAYFPARGQSMDFSSPFPPFGNWFGFIKQGNNLYGIAAGYGGDPNHVWGYTLDGTLLWESNDLVTYNQSNGFVTPSFIYIMVGRISGALTPVMGVAKLNRATGALISIFDLDNIAPAVLFSVNDSLIYVLTTGGALYYIKNFTDLIFVGRTPITGGPSLATGFYTNGRFYYGGMGVSGFSTNIYSVLLPCPEGTPLIASVSTATNTVAHGANILVNWDDVLEPAVSDRLYLKANDGKRFAPAPLSNQTPGTGIGDGSFSFAIPGGTAPGSYVIQYVSKNAYLVATSAPFTVT